MSQSRISVNMGNNKFDESMEFLDQESLYKAVERAEEKEKI